MGAQILFLFTAFFAISISLNGVYARSASSGKNATGFDSGKVIVKAVNYNSVNLYRDKTALSQMRKKLESLEERLDAFEKPGMFVFCFDSM